MSKKTSRGKRGALAIALRRTIFKMRNGKLIGRPHDRRFAQAKRQVSNTRDSGCNRIRDRNSRSGSCGNSWSRLRGSS